MIRKVSLFLGALLLGQLSFAKQVDEQSAKTIGYNFMKSEGIQADASQMVLAYKATSVVNGIAVTDLYVFNTGNTGFVMVSGEDNVIPVLGYSTEAAFRGDRIPGSVSDWLENYKKQINYVIEKNIQGGEQTAAQWSELKQGVNVSRAQKTSGSGVVSPLMRTLWDQEPYYNALCPYDYSVDSNAVTGCVATAMAQVMKYWNWPTTGAGSNSYSSPYGILSANFGATTYMWDSMPNSVTKKNNFVATLMLHTGVSVNMDYGVSESGAFVNTASSPSKNCAQYALVNYFKYKSTMQGTPRSALSDSAWVKLLKSEADNKRPSIYTGYGNVGGHCFVCDGYTTGDRMHINWGWSGAYNGFFVFYDLVPGGSTFNDDQTLLYDITPDNDPAILGVTEVAASGINIYPNPAQSVINISLQGQAVTKINITDMQGRVLKTITPATNATLVTVSVNDLAEGMYLVSLQSAQGTETRRIVVAN